MNRGKNLELMIPSDLVMEIFSRLPSKSIARFRSVSKLWSSMLGSPYFKELFKAKSSASPRLLFAVHGDGEWRYYSAPQPQNPYEKSLVVAAEFHTKFHGRMYRDAYCYHESGLIDFTDIITKERPMICNPITGQYAILPYYLKGKREHSLLGFDPIDKQFKVLIMDSYMVYNERAHRILTLGTDHHHHHKLKLRNIQCPLNPYAFFGKGICINGFLYFSAELFDATSNSCSVLIVCFDVRSEKFKFIDAQCITYRYNTKLINYKGKLGWINSEYKENNTLELHMFVLEDVEKHKWLKHVYTLPENQLFGCCKLALVGATARGELVFSKSYIDKQFYVFYFNPERNTLQHVEIQGLGSQVKDLRHVVVHTFVDHVEDLSINDANQLLNSSIYAPPKPQHRDRDRRYDDGKLRETRKRERRNESDRRAKKEKKKKKKQPRDER